MQTQLFFEQRRNAAPGPEPLCLSLRTATGGGVPRVFEKRTRVRFSIFAIAALAAPALLAAESGAEASPSVTFEQPLTGALVAALAALTTWLGVRSREERKAQEKVKVEQERLPPLGEDVARTYATKREVCDLEGRLTAEVGTLRTQIDGNDKTLRRLVEENDAKAESRARGTHARIDALQATNMKTNKAIGVLVGAIAVKFKLNPRDLETEE